MDHMCDASDGSGVGGWSSKGKLSSVGGWEPSIIPLSLSECVRAAEDGRRGF